MKGLFLPARFAAEYRTLTVFRWLTCGSGWAALLHGFLPRRSGERQAGRMVCHLI
jgi:hypothetical protein